jgi:hypothetical protein
VNLRQLMLVHHGQRHLGRKSSRVEKGVGGSDVVTGVLGISKQEAVVRVDGESRIVGGLHRDSDGMSGGNHPRGVPQIDGHFVDLILLHVDGLEAAFAPSHAHAVILDEDGLSRGIQVRDLYL